MRKVHASSGSRVSAAMGALVGGGIIGEMSRRFVFGKSKRLYRRRDFRRVFEGRSRAADGYLTVYVAPNGLDHPRLGIRVGRKFGNAVQRNRVKRLIREAFRAEQAELEIGFDLVCIPRPGRQADLAQYRKSIRRLADGAVKQWQDRAAVPAGEGGSKTRRPLPERGNPR